MIRFIMHRLAMVVPTIIGITIVSFLFIKLLPGDPVQTMAGERTISPETYKKIMEYYGFDRPLHEQYLLYMQNLLGGDMGTSFVSKRPVVSEFLTLFPATLELAFSAMLFAVIFGIPAGIVAAVRRGSVFDHSLMSVSLVGYSMPIFWWGLLLIIIFSSWLQLTPISGRIAVMYFFPAITGFMTIDSLLAGEWGGFISALRHLILPSVVLGTIPLAVIARQTRSAMLEVLNEDYVRTARAKGLSPLRVVGVHALRNGLIPVITTIGLQIGQLIGGAILTETIFSWPGIGHWMIHSIFSRDYAVVQSGLLIIALLVMFINIVVDILYGVINPRVR